MAFHGEPGAFGEAAVRALWPDALTVPRSSVTGVIRAVESGEVDVAVLPVENTVAGGVTAAYDALAAAPSLHAVAETILRVEQCLVGLAGARLEEIEVVASHPVALLQCARFLSRWPRMREESASDTASAARAVAEARDPRRAAIASRLAAAHHGLALLAEGIEDRPDNQTRFLALARSPVSVAPGTRARTSLVFTTRNQPGALLRALEPIANADLNLSKLESRPTGEPWTYRFFADVDHTAGDERFDTAMASLVAATQTCRILGTYARAHA